MRKETEMQSGWPRFHLPQLMGLAALLSGQKHQAKVVLETEENDEVGTC